MLVAVIDLRGEVWEFCPWDCLWIGICVFTEGACVDLYCEISGRLNPQGFAYLLWGKAL
jgi:hypothetical protein